jgi:hypothetical protein
VEPSEGTLKCCGKISEGETLRKNVGRRSDYKIEDRYEPLITMGWSEWSQMRR